MKKNLGLLARNCCCLLLLTFIAAKSVPVLAQSTPPNNNSKALTWSITGKLTSSKGQALAGVSVLLKGTKTGAQTDAEGSYRLNVPEGRGVLVFSFIGYTPVERSYSAPGVLDVTLEDDSRALEGVLVTGYTAQRKRDVTGAVAVVDMQALRAQSAASATEALQGKAAGVNIVNDGSPGSTPQIRIRGFSTINNNEPLYVVDGVPYQGKLSWLNQNDIQNIQVLKDASAASIYGSRANNGVVIITSRQGKEGPPQFSFDAYVGNSSAFTEKFPKFMTPLQYAQYLFQSYRNAGVNPGDAIGGMYGKGQDPVLPTYLIAGSVTGMNVTPADADPAKYSANPSTFYQITKASQTGTDWMRTIMHNGLTQSYQLGAAGGGKNATYSVSANYQNQQGIVRYTGFKRYSVRSNAQFGAFNNRLKFGENILFSRTDGVGFATNNNTPGDYNAENSVINSVYKNQTIIPVYDIAGNFAGPRGSNLGDGRNSLAVLYRAKDNFTRENRLFGNIFGEATFKKDFVVRTSFGVNLNNYNLQNITYPNLEAPTGSSTNSYSTTQGYGTQWTWTNTINYKHVFNQKHNLSVLAGSEAIKSSSRDLTGARNGFFILGDQNYYYLNAGSSNISNSENGSRSSLFSLFARADYAFNDKYLLSATIRRDGSSNFGSVNRYGIFSAFSAAWRISDENFLKGVAWLQDLKVRVGYGETGNQNIPANNAVDVYQSLITNSYYPITGSNTLTAGARQNQIGNPLLKWETVKATNLGIDFAIINNMFDGSIDVYKKTTSGMLFPVPLPSQTAGLSSSPYVNAGNMLNQGIELVLNYHFKPANQKSFRFDAGVNFARNQNKIVTLAPGVQNMALGNFRSLTTTIFMVGQPYGEFYGYKQDGIFQSSAEVLKSTQPGARIGGIRFADVDGDGKFSSNDRTVLGSPLPTYTAGINLNFYYKNLELTTFFYTSQGNKIYNQTKYFTDFQAFPSAGSTRLLNAWSPTNTNSNIPSPSSTANAIEYQSSSYYIEDGSYFRLKNVQLGYNIKNNFLGKKIGISKMRVYASVTNLFTITKYSGMDPEISQANQTFGLPGIDFGVYPNARQMLVGINANF
jgi:TonB-linked SusC/RagA family outer membrane protein